MRNWIGYSLWAKKRDVLRHLFYLLCLDQLIRKFIFLNPFGQLIRKFNFALFRHFVGVSKQRNPGGGVSIDAEHKILSEGINGRAIGFFDVKLAVEFFHDLFSLASPRGRDALQRRGGQRGPKATLTKEDTIDFRERQIMAKNLEDYVYDPSMIRYARAMNLSLASLAAELSVAMESGLKAAMDNARNAMDELKDAPTPTLPPI